MREIVMSYFWVFLVIVLLGPDPSADKVIAHGVSQRQVVVARGGHVPVLHDRVVDVPTERLLDVGHIFDHGYSAHADLLAPVVIRLHLSRHVFVANEYLRPLVVVCNENARRLSTQTRRTTPIPSDDPARCSRP